MKRQLAIFVLIALLWVILPGLPTLAKPTRIPHENPATASESLEIAPLITSYGRVIILASNKQYVDAQSILNEARHADIPEEIRNVVDRYGNLYQRLLDALKRLKPLPETVLALLDSGKVEEARKILDDAEIDIQDADALAKDIAAATDIMNRELGTSAGPMADLVQPASAQLADNLEQLNQLLDRLRLLRYRLFQMYMQKSVLIPTELSLNIMPVSAFVGGTVRANGRLTIDGNPLPGRRIFLSTSGLPIVTDDDGFYSAEITLPYTYNDSANIMAAFHPTDTDMHLYLACESPPVTIRTAFYHTNIEVLAPHTIQPGKPFTISGQVSPSDGTTIRQVSILLNNKPAAQASVTEHFSLEIASPVDSPPERQELTVFVTPQRRFSGAIEKRTLITSTLPVYIDLQAPKIAVLPNKASISGRVYDDAGPVTDALVTINLSNRTVTTRTAGDGSFSASVGTPLDLLFLGIRPLTVTATLPEPWYSRAHSEQTLYTINLLIPEIIAFILLAAWILANPYRRPQGQEITAESQSEMTELTAVTPVPLRKTRLTGIKGRIISAYRGGLEAVVKFTGTGLAPNVTLREFLTITRQLAPTAGGSFTELTSLAEAAIYSGRSLAEDTAARAEQLASDIHEELHRGTA